MVTENEPADGSQGSLILQDLMERVAQLPAAERDRIMPELARLKACLDDTQQALRESQSSLQESQDRFQILADSNPLLIWMADENGGNYYINQTYRDYLGVSLEHVRGLNWQHYVHPEDAEAYTGAIQQAIQEQRSFQAQVRVRRADGAWRWLESLARPRFSSEGRFLGFVGNSTDITDRKQAEEFHAEILKRAAWLARLPQENPNPVARIHRDGQVLFHNRPAAELPGWSLEIGKQVPEAIRKLIEQANAERRKVEHDLHIGDRDYSITIMPFPEEGYANLYCLDITERKQAEQALQLANARLRFYIDSNLVGVVVGKADGTLVEVNDYYLNLLGYSRAEFEDGKVDWRSITPPEHLLSDEQAIAELQSFGVTSPYEKEYIRKDGSRIWVYLRDVRLPNDQIGAVVLDIDSRKRAEKSLEKTHLDLIQERNRLVAIMDALPIGLAILDSSGGVMQANRNYEAIWGSPRPRTYSIEDYDLYKAWWVSTGQRVQLDEWASTQAVQLGKTVTGQFFEIQKFDGTHAFIWNSAAPICDASGQVAGAVVTIMDVTERILAEKALQESQERFRVALSSVPLMVYSCDRNLRYRWIYNIFKGFQYHEVLGKRDDEILPPESVVELIAAKQQALDTGQGGIREICVPIGGEIRYYLLTTEPIKTPKGYVAGLTCSAIDITEQKLLEIEQEENKMRMEVQHRLMEYREKERQEIARDLHDGPIQLISGTIFHLQIAREVAQDPILKLEMEQATLNLKGAVRELRDIMNELRPPAIIHFGLAKTARMYAEDFRERNPELTLNLQLFEDGDLLAEPVRLALFRIFQESLNNIAKHANASKVWVRLLKKGSEIHLRIRDNGKGFEVPSDLVGQTQRGHYGLAGMKERAEAMGGTFTVTSEPGKGTTTHVIVPVADERNR